MTKTFVLTRREWAEADQAAVHARNISALERALASNRIRHGGVTFAGESDNADGASVDLTYDVGMPDE